MVNGRRYVGSGGLPVSREDRSRSSTCSTRSNVSITSRMRAMRPSRRVRTPRGRTARPGRSRACEEQAKQRRDLVALCDKFDDFVAHFRVALVDSLPHRAHLGLAAMRTEMRQDVDRRGGDEFDIVGAARQRALDVAGVVRGEQVQHALTVQLFTHHLFTYSRSRRRIVATQSSPCIVAAPAGPTIVQKATRPLNPWRVQCRTMQRSCPIRQSDHPQRNGGRRDAREVLEHNGRSAYRE